MDSLILASASPRRREILSSLGIVFTSINPDIDETIFDHLPVPGRVLALAGAKARSGAVFAAAAFSAHEIRSGLSDWVLGSDTLVWIPGDNLVLGKPESESDARRMICALSGRIHMVSTGVALLRVSTGKIFTARSDSLVSFARMSESEITRYIDSGDWEGAAGAYKIQGRAALHIEKIEGSWSGIVGLPIRELYVILNAAEFRLTP